VMFTPGFEEENRMKPEIVKTIEGTADGLTAEQAALALFKGE
jgi:3-dehydrosphinganine reductase